MSELLGLAERIAGQALPGEQLEAYVARGRSTSVRAYRGEVEALTQAESAGVGVRVVVDGRQGFASAGTLDEGVIADTLAEARDNARFGEPDPWYGLAEPDGVAPPSLELYRPSVAAIPTARKVELAIELERLVTAGDPRIIGVRTASYGDGAGEAAVATSTGIAVASRATSCWLSASALAADGGETQTGHGVDVGRDLDSLDLEATAAEAVSRATRMLGARKAPSQRLTVVLEPRVTAAFLGIIGGMLSGERVLKGRSPFADRLGEEIASPLLTLVDDATDPRSLGADTHDGEGLATRRIPLIGSGVLRSFLHDTYTARRAGAVSTASAVRGYASTPAVGAHALQIEPGTRSAAEVLAEAGDGLLVQSVSGLHSGVNPVSGDFSVGVEGLRIRGGELAEPVREVTIASALQRMLRDVVAVGADLEWEHDGTAGVSLALRDVSLSGS
ncbi:MAG: TldD/PmbA family protein [Acidimicrobiales bacterium]|nr:TldD/PmbA family protein [Acidimicrobiales bacterium]